MNKRHRLRKTIAAGVIALGALVARAAETPKEGYKIHFIREKTPAFTVPTFAGERYTDLVPDTLDIQERIALAVNGLTGPADPEKDYMLYFTAQLMANPPKLPSV